MELSTSMLVFVCALAYLSLIFDMGLQEWIALAGCLALNGAIANLIASQSRRRHAAPITHYLKERAIGVAREAVSMDTSSALRNAISLPLCMQRAAFGVLLTTLCLVPVLMWAIGFDGWLATERLRSLAIVSFAASLVGGLILFYRAERRFSDLRDEIAAATAESGGHEKIVVRHSLQRKIMLAVAIPTFASLLLMVDVVGQNIRSSDELGLAEWASLAVEQVALGDAERPLGERVSTQLPSEEFWRAPVEISEFRENRLSGFAGGDDSEAFLAALDESLERAERSGLLVPIRGPLIGAFRTLDDGRLLVASVERASLSPQMASHAWVVVIVGLALIGLSLVVGRSVAADVRGSVENLRRTADRLADGDLTPGPGVGTDDEFGVARHALAAVGARLTSTVEHVSSTAEATDRMASEISIALTELADANASHSEQIQHAGQVVARIASRVDQTTVVAAALGTTIDESGTSLLELGATGDELNETASALTSKVAAVSDSLEEMVKSVRQVAGTSERLMSASEETSSSMEEMASAMREVDTSAETTANLSREVVSKAELGQAKVVQTIAGMEAIREATDVAEKVIRGLGARTHEIGGILDVIDDVADETNLLALNAAIIAAQAGDHGKAFSVVADEIKELADRVLASTKEIGGLIRAVQDESENAIGAIEAGSASVMSGVDLSAEAGRTLEEITVTSRESGLRISEIVLSVREQTKAASHVVGLMEKVRESAEEIGEAGRQQEAGNEVIYQSALAMREVAQQVRHTTHEQTVGFGRIQENVAGVREAIETITRSMGEQVRDCRQAKQTLGRESQENQSGEDVAKKMQDAVGDLVTRSAVLREDAERFRI